MSVEHSSTNKKKLLLGISGGIAAYKCADLTRRLSERGFEVRVVMTKNAETFVTPMTLQAVSGNPVHVDLFDAEMEAGMGHIELARWADFILIAPATANTMAKIAHGEADNLLTTLVLASKAPLFIAPAMNQQMWADVTTQDNLNNLVAKNVTVLGPAVGEQACGDVGAGRMLEPLEIAEKMQAFAFAAKPLKGKKILITAGPTVEAIDPVRFISNHSSGKMGYAIANAAKLDGAEVVLVSGPVCLNAPQGVTLIQVTSAKDMLQAVKDNILDVDIFIGCAAVADYSPMDVAAEKIKKNEQEMVLKLVKNPDILAWVGAMPNKPFVVGFAAESQSLKSFAQKKLEKKNLDMICANDISHKNLGFNSDNNQLLLLFKNGEEKLLKVASKVQLATQLIDEVVLRIQNVS